MKPLKKPVVAGRRALGWAFLGVASLLLARPAYSLPSGGEVKAGSAQIQQVNPTSTNILQQSERAVINWQDFSVKTNEQVNFLQPSSTSATLNRVTGNQRSDILGRVTANGLLMLVNRNGILFGPTAKIDVGGLMATTLDISNADFMAGKYKFSIPGLPAATVENQGTITVKDGGFAALVAPGVANSGTINARLGKVALTSGKAATLDFYGDGLISVAVPNSLTTQLLGADGKPLSALVNNSGTINADGGIVTLTAATGAQVVNNAINMSGVIQARSVNNQNGTITLSGGDNGNVAVTGLLDASGTQSNSNGGTVNITSNFLDYSGATNTNGATGGAVNIQTHNFLDAGSITADGNTGGAINVNYSGSGIQTASALTSAKGAGGNGGVINLGGGAGTLTTSGTFDVTGNRGGSIHLFGQRLQLLAAKANASGATGGGEILVGGDFQGKTVGATNAQNTFVNPSSSLSADALRNGNGGKVVVWADADTKFYGIVSAKGGIDGGNGGKLEVSGKNNLLFGGTGNASAANGLAGQLLLDPKNIIIDSNGANSLPLIDPDSAAGNKFGYNTAVLGNGNIVVSSPGDSLAASKAGAVYLFDGNTRAVLGTIKGANAYDNFGNGAITVLSNGNYVFGNQNAKIGGISGAGTVILANGTNGTEIGRISGANANENFGRNAITALSNGNYVFGNPYAKIGGNSNAGTVILASGTAGTEIGRISGANAGDNFGNGAITALSNSNYVFGNYNAKIGGNSQAGTVILANGTNGTEIGRISGANAGDYFGNGAITALSNGNYVFGNPNAKIGGNSQAGTVILADGTKGTEIGRISGANAGDKFGNGAITALSNGNYVFGNPYAKIGGNSQAGTVILANGTAGTEIGRISGANANDSFGNGAITVLSNGNYVFGNPYAKIGGNSNAGTVILANGTNGTEIGRISGANAYENFGRNAITALSNGNYVFGNQYARIGGNSQAGTVILANGTNGTEIGRISGANANDNFGSGAITVLSNGNYVFGNSAAKIGGNSYAGTVILADGTNGTEIGRISGANAYDYFGTGAITALSNGNNYVFGNPNANSGAGSAYIGLNPLPTPPPVTSLTYSYTPSADVTITPNQITAITNTGTALVLQANNDITLKSAITSNNPSGNGGDLTLQAGRSILLKANITTANGNLNLIANDTLANGVVDAQRDTGTAVINATNSTINTGSGNLLVQLLNGAGKTNTASGDINLSNITTTGNITAQNTGGGKIIFNNPINAASLTTSGTGITQLNGNITTTGTGTNQNYQNAVKVGTPLTLASNNGNISFGSTLDSNSGASDLTINAGTGNITFTGAVGGTNALGNLTTSSTGTTSFNAVNAASLTTSGNLGTTQLNGNVTTTGTGTNQNYQNAVKVGTPLTLASNDGNVSFGSTLDSNSGASNLTINAGTGGITFTGAVGGTTPLGRLTTSSTGTTSFNAVNAANLVINPGGITQLNGNITTTAANASQSYPNPTLIGGATSLTTSNGNVSFGSTLDSTTGAANNLNVNAGTGNITFTGAVGGTTALGSLTTSSTGTTNFNTVNAASLTTSGINGTTQLNGNVTTTGTGTNQNYNNAVQLATPLTLASNNGNISFGSTLDSNSGASDLTINAGTGNITFTGAVGGTTALGNLTTNSTGTTSFNTVNAASLTTSGNLGTTQLNGNVTTTGSGTNQNYQNAVKVGTPLTLASNNGNVSFGSTLDSNSGASNLTINAGTGGITFTGTVGGTTPLGSLTTSSTGTTSFNAVNAANLVINPGGITQLNGNITTTAANASQSYPNPTLIGGATSLTTSNGNVSFGSTLDSTTGAANNLNVNAGTGNITFTGAVGGTTALGSLTTSSTGTTNFNTVNAASLTTSGINGTTQLNGNVTTTGTGTNQNYNNAVQLATPLTLASNNGNISFGSTLDSNSGASDLTINAGTGNITFTGAVGGTNALGNLTTSSTGTTSFNGVVMLASLATTGNNGTTQLNGNFVNTTGSGTNQNYGNAVKVGKPLTLISNNGNIYFRSTLDSNSGAANLTIYTGTGNAIFLGAAGSTKPLGNLIANSAGITAFGSSVNAANVTTDLGGSTVIKGNITTSGTTPGQSYSDAVSVRNDVTLTSDKFNFAGGVSGLLSSNLTLLPYTPSANLPLSIISQLQNLASVSIGGGTIIVPAGTTTFNTPLNLLSPVQVSGKATLTSNGNNNLTFAQSVDSTPGSANSLTLNTGAGNITFKGAVGNNAPLGDINTTSSGTTSFNTVKANSITTNPGGTSQLNGNVTTTGTGINQNYQNAVQLGTPVTLASNNGNIYFRSTLDSNSGAANNLTISTGAGNAIFLGAVGSTTPLGDLIANSAGITAFGSSVNAANVTTDLGGSTVIKGNITTSGTTPGQSYFDAVSVRSDVTLTSDKFNFAGGVSGLLSSNLTLRPYTPSATLSLGVVNQLQNLASVSIGGTGTITVPAGTTTFTTPLNLLSPVQVSGNATLTSNGSNNLSFAQSVDSTPGSANNLTLNTGTGNITFTGAVGSTNPLGSISIQNAGNVTANNPITASSYTQSGVSGTTALNNLTTTGGIVNINGSGSITTNNVTTKGGAISLNSPSITTGVLDSTSTTGNGGAIAVTTNSGNINTGAIKSGSSFASAIGGNIKLSNSAGNINAGAIDSSSSNGANSGTISLRAANGKITALTINADNAGAGGSGDIGVTAGGLFQVSGTFTDGVNSSATSISTANSSANNSGTVQIQQGGVRAGQAFNVGSASTNGTAGAISAYSILSGVSITSTYASYANGTIIITSPQ